MRIGKTEPSANNKKFRLSYNLVIGFRTMNKVWAKRLLTAVMAISMMVPHLTAAQDSNVVRTGNAEIELGADHTVVTPGQQFFIGLAMTHDENWHTYWLNAGDSGQHLKTEWQNEPSILISKILWPTPEVIPTPPLTSYGYKDSILLPMFAKGPENIKPGTDLKLKVHAKWLECADICLPNKADLSLTLKVGKKAEKHDDWFEIFDVLVATKSPVDVAVWDPRAIYGKDEISLQVTAQGLFAERPYKFRFIPAMEGVINDSANQEIFFDPETKVYTLVIERDDFSKKAHEVLEGLLVFDDEGVSRSLYLKAATNAATMSKEAVNLDGGTGSNITLWLALLFAFIGGLILNLMPCVLPVLAIKVTHIVEHAGKKAQWKHGVAFAGGVLLTFWVLALGLIVLKEAGHVLGWGFQLQNPVFVLAISVVLLAVALDLVGLYEVGASFTKLAGKDGKHKGLAGSFLTGVLATVVATPCTAPFMGSALAFTLDKSAFVVLLVFTGLALGLAFPYMVLTAKPKLLSFLPKPGPWMVTFKQVLAFPVLATIVWLLWLIGQQTGVDGMMITMGVLLSVAVALWIWGRFGQDLTQQGRKRMAATLIAILIGGMGLIGGMQLISNLDQVERPAAELSYENALPFAPGLAASLQNEGKASFVIFTADWCITCKVNEKTVLKSEEIQKLFKDNNVQIIVADWTNENPDITAELNFHGRAGVPFYLYYTGVKDAAPIALPELLSKADVKQALNSNK
ncbi:MAG: hypothetical protein CMF62_05740 [Magnetococcales bacterium]|nr:hypothetical protein [Magnetococcales bacterium]